MSAGFSKKVTLFLSLLLAVLLAAIGVLWFLTQMKSRDPLADVVIPPDTPRAGMDHRWEETVNPTMGEDPMESRYLDSGFNWQVTDLSPVGKEISFKFREAPSDFETVTKVVHLRGPDYVWQDGPRRVELALIGVGQYDPGVKALPGQYRYKARYFMPSGQEVAEDDLPPVIAAHLSFNPYAYTEVAGLRYSFILRVDGFVEGKRDVGMVFDRNTRVGITGGWTYGFSEGVLRVDLTSWVAHPSPLLTSVNLVSGEPEVFELDPEQTATLDTPHFKLLYHGSRAGAVSGHNSTRWTDTSGVTEHYGPYKFDSVPDRAFLGFSLTPAAKSLQTTLRLAGKNDRTVDSPISRDTVVNWPAPIEDLEKILVTHYPEVTRVIIHAPELPVALENQGLTNLLDATIPAVRVEETYQWRAAIGKLAMLKVEHIPGAPATPTPTLPPLPREFQDITLRELIYLYLEYHPGEEITYNPLSNTLTFSPIDRSTPWQRTVRWVNERLP